MSRAGIPSTQILLEEVDVLGSGDDDGAFVAVGETDADEQRHGACEEGLGVIKLHEVIARMRRRSRVPPRNV